MNSRAKHGPFGIPLPSDFLYGHPVNGYGSPNGAKSRVTDSGG